MAKYPQQDHDFILGLQRNIGALGNRILTLENQHAASGLPWRTVGAAGEPAFLNNWVNYDGGVTYQTAAFYRDPQGIVHLKGLIKNGTLGAPVFVLPVGYRPFKETIFACLANSAISDVRITAAGVLSQNVGSNTWLSLANINFRAEQ